MASEIDICNIALSHLGDTATVSSIDPPEGSAQAELCARFYPVARDSLLEMHPWGFSVRRAQLALLSSSVSSWSYCYAVPADAINLIAVLSSDATNDYSTASPLGIGQYTPQPFVNETDDSGASVIYTNQDDAVLRYAALVTDTTKFSPLFVNALSWHLASFLAGPILKGDVGAAESKRCTQMMMNFLSAAQESDAAQRRVTVAHNVPWIAGR